MQIHITDLDAELEEAVTVAKKMIHTTKNSSAAKFIIKDWNQDRKQKGLQ